jgi:uncharacterized protein
MAFTFLRAEWRKLIMAQYEVPPAALAPFVPAGLDLDLFHGRCFVSLVGFLFDRVKLLGIGVPGHERFEEINLRFYVKRSLPDGSWRRGVVFLSEIVPRAAITLTAKALYGEAYSTARTRHRWSTEGGRREAQAFRHSETGPLEVGYEWRHRRMWNSVAVRAGTVPHFIAPGSMEEFITEHYFGYTRRRDGQTAEYAVEHPRWLVYPIEQHRIVCDFGSLYGRFGPAFAALEGREPAHVLLAEGSPVGIRWGGTLQ